MSFLSPIWLAAAALGALAVFALHLITTQRPPPSIFPTARFVPQSDARATSRAARPTDLLLLLLRCAALLLLGAAFAGPVRHARGTSLARVLVVDRSRSALADARDSALTLARQGDALVLFDSAARHVTSGIADSIRSLVPGRSRGSLSAALVAAQRAARTLSRGADSVELIIVSPVTADELDAASAGIAARWPGRARLVRTQAAPVSPVVVTLASEQADDALRPAIDALNAGQNHATAARSVRVVRRAPLAADSAAARAGAAVVVWLRAGNAAFKAEGLWAGTATIVAPLARLPLARGGRAVARWADGAPAAVEWQIGSGCIREVGVGVPPAGDLTIQPAFVSVARSLFAACDGAPAGVPASDSVVRVFGRGGAAAGASDLHSIDERSALAPWLLGAAMLLLAGETLSRRRGGAVVS